MDELRIRRDRRFLDYGDPRRRTTAGVARDRRRSVVRLERCGKTTGGAQLVGLSRIGHVSLAIPCSFAIRALEYAP